MKNAGIFLATVFVAVMAFGTGRITVPKQEVLGSVVRSSEYNSTSTSYLSTLAPLVDSDDGTLGSVVITGANTGIMNFYNATTTNKNLRTNQTPTSTILIASIPASTAAGTYTFDVNYSQGLLVEIVGNAPTSTITYR